ncbi:MAG: SAM-dependent methyltransferase [Hyphomicrobiaceae bacterium]
MAAELTPLDVIIRDRITREGPISVYDFMTLALSHPEHGYYRARPAIGRSGDFITAPEISQTFGEILGLWTAVAAQMAAPEGPLALIEIGPGRGTLMADALRALKVVPGLMSRLSVHLVEPSPALRAEQEKVLANAPVTPHWHERLSDVPLSPSVVLANEVVDALPVRQLVRHSGQWHERVVAIGADGALAFTIGEPVSIGLASATDGDILEMRPDVAAFVGAIAERARSAPTAALLIDYGHERTGVGDTLQAIRHHQRSDPLARAGESDLTAQVDFEALAAAADACGLAVDGPVPQASFLGVLGIVERAERLMRTGSSAQAATIEAGVLRLIDPSGMGSRFKVLGLRSPGIPRLPGL